MKKVWIVLTVTFTFTNIHAQAHAQAHAHAHTQAHTHTDMFLYICLHSIHIHIPCCIYKQTASKSGADSPRPFQPLLGARPAADFNFHEALIWSQLRFFSFPARLRNGLLVEFQVAPCRCSYQSIFYCVLIYTRIFFN